MRSGWRHRRNGSALGELGYCSLDRVVSSSVGMHERGTGLAETKAALEYESQEETPLKQAISRRMLVFFVIGDILGAGIYALVGEVGGKTGGAIWSA